MIGFAPLTRTRFCLANTCHHEWSETNEEVFCGLLIRQNLKPVLCIVNFIPA